MARKSKGKSGKQRKERLERLWDSDSTVHYFWKQSYRRNQSVPSHGAFLLLSTAGPIETGSCKNGVFVGGIVFRFSAVYGRFAREGGRAAEDAAVTRGRIFLTLGWHWNNFALILKILYRVKQMLHLLFNQAN